LDLVQALFQLETDVLLPEVTKLDGLPIVHVVELEEDGLALDHNALELGAELIILRLVLLVDLQGLAVNQVLAALHHHLERHTDLVP
jgi:hypothetical protein